MTRDKQERRKFQHLSVEEREEIAILISKKMSRGEIGRMPGRHRSTVCRELKRNRKKWKKYRAHSAQKISDKRQRISRKKEMLKTPEIRQYVMEKIKLRHSPEQIAGRDTANGILFSTQRRGGHRAYTEKKGVTDSIMKRDKGA